MKGRNMLKVVFLLASIAAATPDLVAPFTVDVKSQVGFLDTIIVTTYLANIGTTETEPKTFDATIVSIGIDSNNIRGHQIPANLVLAPGKVAVYKDTIAMIPHQFSIFTWCDPLTILGEGGGELVNNVRSQAYNYYPTIIKDTVKVVVHDTVKTCPAPIRSIASIQGRPGSIVVSPTGRLLGVCKD